MEKRSLTSDAVLSSLMGLTARDYYAGPESDLIGQGEVWKFAPLVKTQTGMVQMYVKLKISPDRVRAICISFHDAEHPVKRFPYREEDRL